MTGYRDAQAELRIGTLEAKLAERDAALRARDLELVEARANFDRVHGDGKAPAAGGWRRGVVAALAVTLVAVGAAAYAREDGGSRLASAEREIAQLRDTLARERAKPSAPRESETRVAPPRAEFDRVAAYQSLAGAAQEAKGCGTTGSKSSHRIKIIFEPTGLVSSAVIQDDTAFAASTSGRCVVERFRRAHVPPFDGSPVVVTKSYSVLNEVEW